MQSLPFLPTLNFELKTSPSKVSFENVVEKFCVDSGVPDIDNFRNAASILTSLRQAAMSPSMDFNGLNSLKKYFGQLHLFSGRVEMTSKESPYSVEFCWFELYCGRKKKDKNVRFELSSLLYNIGALHCILASKCNFSETDELKVACTHYLSAAGVFDYLREDLPCEISEDCGVDAAIFYSLLMLIQAQELLFYKSLRDEKSPPVMLKLARQLNEYCNKALAICECSEVLDIIASKKYMCNTEWNYTVRFKQAIFESLQFYFASICGANNEKYGESVVYSEKAYEVIKTVLKDSKGNAINSAIQFIHDECKLRMEACKRDNDFIYFDKIPAFETLDLPKGVSVVKPLPFKPYDPEIVGPDLFPTIVGMDTLSASSIYSEKKAALLREIIAEIEEKDVELKDMLEKMGLDQITFPTGVVDPLPQDLVEMCASLSVKPNAVQDLKNHMSELAKIFEEVDDMLHKIISTLDKDKSEDEALPPYLKSTRPRSVVTGELEKECERYKDAHCESDRLNGDLKKALNQEINSLELMSGSLEEVSAEIPSPNLIKTDSEQTGRMHKMIDKIDEMKVQRVKFLETLRQQISADDITVQLSATNVAKHEEIMASELLKHDGQIKYIRQNLTAQANIINAIVDAHADFAQVRKEFKETELRREAKIQSLRNAYDRYNFLVNKCQDARSFYEELAEKVATLLQRVTSVCKVQEDERKALVIKSAPKRPVAAKPILPSTGSSSGIDPQLIASLTPEEKKLLGLSDDDLAEMLKMSGSVEYNPLSPSAPDLKPAPLRPPMNPNIRPHAVPPRNINPSNTFSDEKHNMQPMVSQFVQRPHAAFYGSNDPLRPNFNEQVIQPVHPQNPQQAFHSVPQIRGTVQQNMPTDYYNQVSSNIKKDEFYQMQQNQMPPQVMPSANRGVAPQEFYRNQYQPIVRPPPQGMHYRPEPDVYKARVMNPYQSQTHSPQPPPVQQTQNFHSPQHSVGRSIPDMQFQGNVYHPHQQSISVNPQYQSHAFQVPGQSMPRPLAAPTKTQSYQIQSGVQHSAPITLHQSQSQNIRLSGVERGESQPSQTMMLGNQPPAQQQISEVRGADSISYQQHQHQQPVFQRMPLERNTVLQQSGHMQPIAARSNSVDYHQQQIQQPPSAYPPQRLPNSQGYPNTDNYQPQSFPQNQSFSQFASHESSQRPQYGYNIPGNTFNQIQNNSRQMQSSIIESKTPNFHDVRNTQMESQKNIHEMSEKPIANIDVYKPNLQYLEFQKVKDQSNTSSFSNVANVTPPPASIAQASPVKQPAKPFDFSLYDPSKPMDPRLMKSFMEQQEQSIAAQQMNFAKQGSCDQRDPVNSLIINDKNISNQGGQFVNQHPDRPQNVPHHGQFQPASTQQQNFNESLSQQRIQPQLPNVNSHGIQRQPFNMTPNSQNQPLNSMSNVSSHATGQPVEDFSSQNNSMESVLHPMQNLHMQHPVSIETSQHTQSNSLPQSGSLSTQTVQTRVREVSGHASIAVAQATNSQQKLDANSSLCSISGQNQQESLPKTASCLLTEESSAAALPTPLMPTSSKKPPQPTSKKEQPQSKEVLINNDVSVASQSEQSQSKQAISKSDSQSVEAGVVKASANAESLANVNINLNLQTKVLRVNPMPAKSKRLPSKTMERLTQETDRLEKLVLSLNQKTLAGSTVLENIWKEIVETDERYSRKLSCAVSRCNTLKNRSADFIPYDENRIVLDPDDYINASSFEVANQYTPRFILSQNVLPACESEFWRMLYHTDSRLLVDFVSCDDPEFHIFWPEKQGAISTYGSLKICHQSTSKSQYWLQRSFVITHVPSKHSHTITHLQFSCWPVEGVPSNPAPFISFVHTVRNFYSTLFSYELPVCLICPTGVSRCGVFATVFLAIQELDFEYKTLDLAAAVRHFCRQRKHLMMNAEHLNFAYSCQLYAAQQCVSYYASKANEIDSNSRSESSRLTIHEEKFALERHSPTTMPDILSDVVAQTKPIVEDKSSNVESLLNPETFSLGTSSFKSARITRESFETPTSHIGENADTSDPLNQIDPLWKMK